MVSGKNLKVAAYSEKYNKQLASAVFGSTLMPDAAVRLLLFLKG